MDNVTSWCAAVSSEQPGSMAKLAAAQDWTGAACLAGDEHAVQFAIMALTGWLDSEYRGHAAQAVEAELQALGAWLRG